jgi:hypothetical protein
MRAYMHRCVVWVPPFGCWLHIDDFGADLRFVGADNGERVIVHHLASGFTY